MFPPFGVEAEASKFTVSFTYGVVGVYVKFAQGAPLAKHVKPSAELIGEAGGNSEIALQMKRREITHNSCFCFKGVASFLVYRGLKFCIFIPL